MSILSVDLNNINLDDVNFEDHSEDLVLRLYTTDLYVEYLKNI